MESDFSAQEAKSQKVRLREFAELIRREQAALLKAWRDEVRHLPSAVGLDVPTLNDHIPDLLDEIVEALIAGSDETIAEALVQESPPDHGVQRLTDGFDIVEVVAEYNILRGSLYNLAEKHGINMSGAVFHILNRILDGAIALAVSSYAEAQAKEIQARRDEYLAFIAHDLRTPLNAISLAASLLELYTPNASAKATEMLTILGRNIAHLDSLVQNIVEETVQTQADGQQLQLRTFDLWPLVEGLILELRPQLLEAGVQLVNMVPNDLSVVADAHLTKRIFQNLIANALEYTPKGRIEVGAKAGPPVECWVADNGEGIPADRQGLVFEKLESDPSRESGTGLGLAIVKTFVELHGGAISLKSEQGVGSEFRFTLSE